MFDTNWETISGEAAFAIEVLNQSNVINVIEAILRYFIFHDTTPGPSCGVAPNESPLRELHRTGTFLLLQRPGAYRNADVVVHRRDGGQYDPPQHDQVEELVEQFAADLLTKWPDTTAVSAAAFALWRINWIHPFKNGNGRTARAFAYLCVCLRYGFMLPGERTLVDLIMDNRDEYEAALSAADAAFAATGAPDLAAMEAYVERLLREQLASIPLGSSA